ncbi:MAG: glycosyltransferase, partial [Gammaproteobacteria bacterium]|nr:glycosyltransferase [Gammaproteobacteria bacterium]
MTEHVGPGTQPRIALCLEQTLGHRTHGQNIERALDARGIDAARIAVHPPARRALPIPWALRSSFDAARQLRALGRMDVTFFHTQTLSLFASLATRGTPYVVSVDATPAQIDDMGMWYEHGRHQAPLESAKRSWYRRVLTRSAGIVTWSAWAAESLRADYGVRFAGEADQRGAVGAGARDVDVPATPRLLVAHPG